MAALFVTSASNTYGQRSRQKPRLEGTFLQLLQGHADWPPSRWNELFGYFHDLGLRQIIVQWSVLDDLAFYRSAKFKVLPAAPLEAVLREADRLGMSVQLGLVHDSNYWSRIAQDPATVTSYFDQLRLRSMATAQELTGLIGRHKCVKGWYLPGEVDDVNWHDEASREALLRHLSALSVSLQKLTPNLTISISTFAQGRLSPAGFEEFWNIFFSRTKIDSVYLQDGVGVNKLDIAEVPPYMSALHAAAVKNKRRASAIIELLQQTSGPPINQSAFQATPGPLERILRQMESVSQFAPEGMIGFSVPEYMTPFGGKEAGELFEQYRAYRAATWALNSTVVSRRADP
jgi:Domain of unknown function (DUF4434)